MHLLLHGIGGFVGGSIGYFVAVDPAHCTLQTTLQQICTNRLGVAPVTAEGAITVGAIIGILVYHGAESIIDDIREATAKRRGM